MAKARKPQAPKQRNFDSCRVRDAQMLDRPRTIKNKIKKKLKHPKLLDYADD